MSMSQGYLNNSIKEKERENRLKRIKEAKDLDKKWSKKVVEANRENEIQKKQKVIQQDMVIFSYTILKRN